MSGIAKLYNVGVLFAVVALTGYGTSGRTAPDEPAPPGISGEQPAGQAQFVAGDIDTLPRIRFADGLVSLNDRCPVRLVPLNLRMPPVYVNGRPVGFC